MIKIVKECETGGTNSRSCNERKGRLKALAFETETCFSGSNATHTFIENKVDEPKPK